MLPEQRYVPLYEGRMVHQFDHAAKAYVGGSARRAIWSDLPLPCKRVVPHYFIAESALPSVSIRYRAGFCDVTLQGVERTILATVIPRCRPCGNSVVTVSVGAPLDDDPICHLLWVALVNSFVTDWLARLRVTLHLNFFVWAQIPVPVVEPQSDIGSFLAVAAACLCCTTPEMADLWVHVGSWRRKHAPAAVAPAAPTRDLCDRSALRAAMDARVASLYGLSIAEYARVLHSFALLDRSQPALPGDAFIRRRGGGERAESRSYVTRDTALLEYCRYKGVTPPDDIVTFYAGIDVDISRQTGPLRNLEERVAEATRLGAIAYVPTPTKRRRDE